MRAPCAPRLSVRIVTIVLLWVSIALPTTPPTRVYAQSDPTLDAAEQIIRASEATRVYAATRAALDAYAMMKVR